MFQDHRNKLFHSRLISRLGTNSSSNGFDDTKFLGYTKVPWSRNRSKGAIPSHKRLAPDYPVGLITNFQQKHECVGIFRNYNFTHW